MDALYGDNLTGKLVTSTFEHRMGKWLKKESLLHLKVIYVHNNLKKILQGNLPVITKSFNLPGVAMIISTPSVTIFTCSRLLPPPYTHALQKDTCLLNEVHFSEHIHSRVRKLTFPLINDQKLEISNMTQSVHHILCFMSKLTDGSCNIVSRENI